jgi:chromosome segregation ATPase
MRDRDIPNDFDDIPQLQGEKRENVRAKPAPQPMKKTLASGLSKAAVNKPSNGLYAVLVLIIAMLAFLSFQLYAQATKLDARVMELEGRLSNTDESLSQSGVAMQVAFKELKDRVLEQNAQIDKLWSSAWKKNQSEIESQGKRIDSLSKTVKTQMTNIDKLVKTDADYAAEMKVITARTETLSTMDASIKEQAKLLSALNSKLETMVKTNDSLSRKIEENAGWIESNNAFRKQTNQSLNRIEQQLKNNQSTSATIINP